MLSRAQQTIQLDQIRGYTLELALYSTSPTAQDTGMEITGGAYARIGITFGTVSTLINGSEIVNNSILSFPQASADWSAPVSHWAVRKVGGDMVAHGTVNELGIPTTRVIRSGDIFRLAIGSVYIRVYD